MNNLYGFFFILQVICQSLFKCIHYFLNINIIRYDNHWWYIASHHIYSEICLNRTPLGLTFVFGINIFPTLVYAAFRFIQDFGLYSISVYTGFRSIQHFGLYRISVYTAFRFIQNLGLYSISVNTEFRSIQHFGLYRI